VELNTQTKPVDDFAHIFKPQEIRKITSLINKLEKNTSAEIAVVTEDSLEGRDIAEYANELFNEWGIGKEDKHNGILLLIDKEETKFRIEVGLGLNDVLTPDFINGLFEQYLIPNFKLKKFGPGVYKTLDKIAKKITALYKKRI
ncbi:MAG: TPM domain-containing protein, partial [Actinobacteria bacterium]|nr:TPM domain-containing protein [Actinomycetota bacterium]